MNRTNQTIRYLIYSLKWMLLVEFLISVGIVILTDYVYIQTGGRNLANSAMPGTVRLVAVVFSILVGILYIRPTFRVALANGISRHTFIWAYLPVTILVAVVFTTTSQVIVGIHNWIWPTLAPYGELLTFRFAWLWSIVIQIVLYALLVISGWFLSFIYYRSNTFMKWAISLLIGFVFAFPLIAPEFYYETLSPLFHDFTLWCVGRPERIPLFMLALAIVLYEATFLLIHRAPLKD